MPNFGDLYGGSNIKSVQSGVISISASTGAATIAINPVNPAFHELRMLGVTGIVRYASGDVPNQAANGYVSLTGGGTSITAKTISGTSGTLEISWELTEYYPS